jgi:NADH-quinone oxidoreductase subunit G
MPKIKVNNNELEVEDGLTVLQACEQAGAENQLHLAQCL